MSGEIKGQGPRNARIVIVTEAVGLEESMSGNPISGSRERLLNSVLADVGLERQEIYFTNVVKVRLPGRGFDDLYVDKKKSEPSAMLQNFWQSLKDEITAIKPNVIVALGDEALRALTGERSVSKWHGSVMRTPLGKVIPSFDPSFVLKVYSQRVIMTLDFHKVKRHSQSRTIDDARTAFVLGGTFEQTMQWLKRPHRQIAFDIETVGGFKTEQPIFTRCIGLACSRSEAIIIPLMSSVNRVSLNENGLPVVQVDGSASLGSHWSLEEEKAILEELYRIFADPKIEKIAQNVPFDTQVLEKEFGFKFNAVNWDTMLMHHTVYPELPKGLDFLASMYTSFPYYSDYDVSVDQEVWRYCAYDCVATFWCWQELKRELEIAKLMDFYQHHVHLTMCAVTRVQDRGVQVDVDFREKLRIQTEKELEELQAEVEAMTNGFITKPNSSPQCQEWFYKRLGLPVEINRKTGRPTADNDALEALASRVPEHAELIGKILEYRQKRVLLSTFILTNLTAENEMRTSYNTAGTVTGRLSSSATYEGLGGNLQNIPKGSFRRLYVARKGYQLLKCDLSQAEFRFVVWAAPIKRLIDRYRDDPDFDAHSWSASLVYNIPETEVRKPVREGQEMTYRDYAKNGNYGGNYGMRPRRASKVWKIPYSDAEYLLRRREQILPEVPGWWEKIKAQLNATRTTKNPLGRRRLWFGRLNDDMYRDAYSHEAQSTVADVLNRALLISEWIMPEDECHVLLQVHDELVFECKDEYRYYKRYGQIIKTVMEYPIQFPHEPTPLVMPCDQEKGPNWYDKVDLNEWLKAQEDQRSDVKV